MLCQLFLLLIPLLVVAQNDTIHIGLLVVDTYMSDQIGYATTGGAITVAIHRVNSEHLLDGYNFTFYVKDTECDPANSVGAAVEMILNDDIDFLIGPPCETAATSVAVMSTAYRVPVVTWGYTFNSEFTDANRFPYLANIMTTSLSWNTIGVLYVDDSSQYCTQIVNDLETAVNDPNTINVQISYKTVLVESDKAAYTARLTRARNSARIFAICMATGTSKRNFFIYANQMQMVSSEFLYVMLELRSIGYVTSGLTPFWIDPVNNNSDGMNSVVANAALRVVVIDVARPSGTDINAFNDEVLEDITKWPLYCNWESCLSLNNDSYAALFARALHDAFYLLARTINKTLDSDPTGGFNNPDLFKTMLPGVFNGYTGQVIINENGTREPVYIVSAMNTSLSGNNFLNITVDQNNVASLSYVIQSAAVIWQSYGGVPPNDVPLCGFTGNSCPLGFWQSSGIYVIVAVALVIVLVVGTIVVGIYFLRLRVLERKRQNAEWQISVHELEKPKTSKENKSMRSLASNPSSTSTKLTTDSNRQETSTTAYYTFRKEFVVASKHPPLFRFDSGHQEEFRKVRKEFGRTSWTAIQMRKLDHQNVNKFIGISMDGPNTLCIYRMGSRGSIEVLIERGLMQLDSFFVFSLIQDIAHGLAYLHESFLGLHGNLSSSTCLVDERWQVKLSDFGLRMIRSTDRISKKRQLWMAPEVLRNDNHIVHSSADVYSFAIIASEILSRRSAWDLENRRESIEELIYTIKKGGHNPLRPELIVAEGVEANTALLHLIRDCWEEKADARPYTEIIKSLMRSMLGGKKINLMDHLFKMMEQYTGTLEEEIDERTKELAEEKKTSDILLYRMLPRQVADRLKLGQSVEPESFESVTIFFSDVVKFTQLSQKCTPIQVETIGDGYLCASGLPQRNGNDHVYLMAELALDFMEAVRAYRIPHLREERMNLRIGMNTGPCVAGVVGLAMPRYCVFGDTVNTASRMESNSKAGMIHLSAETHRLLDGIGGYNTQSRGDVIIKGKGVLETFWLLGRSSEKNNNRPPSRKNDREEDQIPHDEFSSESTNNQLHANVSFQTPEDKEGKGMYDLFREKATSVIPINRLLVHKRSPHGSIINV